MKNDTIGVIMEFMALRFLVIGAAVVAVVLVGFVIAVALKKAGKLGQARDFVEPIIRNRVAGKGGVKAGLANMVIERVKKMEK